MEPPLERKQLPDKNPGEYRAERERQVFGITRAGRRMASGGVGKQKPISFHLQNLSPLGKGK